MNACRSPLLTERFIPVKRLEIAKLNKNVRYYEATPEKEESYTSMVIDLDSQE